MFDGALIFLLPAILLSAYAQFKVSSSFTRFSGVRTRQGISAAAVSRMLLDMNELRSVRIENISGSLTDHYDPRSKILRLSESVMNSPSIAAIGVAAHEVGHAVQDRDGYTFLTMRNSFVPVANFGSQLSIPLFILGFMMGMEPLIYVGIALFSLIVLFHIVTLPVEFNASSRALKMLGETGALSSDEMKGASAVLRAAALTYIAAALFSVLRLLTLIAQANMRGRRRG